MRFEGRVWEQAGSWVIELPLLAVVTQGTTKADALEMIGDAVECLADKPGFHVDVHPGVDDHFELGASDQATLTALLLRRQRVMHGLSLAEVARRLGAKSLNGYARYEHGRTVPSIAQLGKLLAAVSAGADFVLSQSRDSAAV